MLYNIDEEVIQKEIKNKSDIEILDIIVKKAKEKKLDEVDYIAGMLYLKSRLPDISDVSKGNLRKIACDLCSITSNQELGITAKTRNTLRGMQNYLALNSNKLRLSRSKNGKNITEDVNYRIGSIIQDANIEDNDLKNTLLQDILLEHNSATLLSDLFSLDNDKVKLDMLKQIHSINKELINDIEKRANVSSLGFYNEKDLMYIIERFAISLENDKSYNSLPYDVKKKDLYHLVPIARALVRNMSDVENRRRIIVHASKSNNLEYCISSLDWNSDEEKLNVINDLPLNEFDFNIMFNRSAIGGFATAVLMSIDKEENFDKAPDKSNFFYIRGKKYCKGIREYEKLSKIKVTDDPDIIDFKLPKGMTVGVEIESAGSCSHLLKKKSNTFNGWCSKEESSIGSLEDDERSLEKQGSEVTSPILSGTKKESKQLKDILKALKVMGQSVNEKCAGHIHINANYFTTAQSLVNLYEIVGNCEKELFIISNETYELPRIGGPTFYAKMFSGHISEDLKKGGIKIPSNLKKRREVLGRLARLYGNGYVSLNSMNAANEYNTKNTIEFRMPNGTLDYKTWIENITLFSSISKAAEELGKLEQKINDGKVNINNLTDKQIEMLRLEEKLKNKELDKDEKVNTLFDLIFDDDKTKQVFKKRYRVNSEMLDDIDYKKNPLEYNVDNGKEYKKEEKASNFDLKDHLYNLFKSRYDVLDLIKTEQEMIDLAAEKELAEKEKNNDEEYDGKYNKRKEKNIESNNRIENKEERIEKRKREEKYINLYKDNNYHSRIEEDR